MKKTIRLRLSQDSIQQARDEVNSFAEMIRAKLPEFVEELADYGISVAEQNTGVWGKYLEFIKEVSETETGCKAVMIMKDIHLIKPPHDDRLVSPSLMAEFGAGKYAIFPAQSSIKTHITAGQGSFPNQVHAFDPKGWWYLGKDDKWHHSYGTKPTRPMYTAYTQLETHVNEVIKRVFK